MSAGAYLDRQPRAERQLFRFLVFALAGIIAMGALGARLFALQIVDGERFAPSIGGTRTVVQAVPSTRGLIYDRNGDPLVANVASFSVKLRAADLPFSRRDEVVSRLAALLAMDPIQIIQTIDANPGSRFELIRLASDVPEEIARIISESRIDLPGVEVVVESRREYLDGPLLSQLLGYTGPVSPDQLPQLREIGYLPDDRIGRAGVEAVYEEQLRGAYGLEAVERDATGRQIRVQGTVRDPEPGSSLRLTIDRKAQEMATTALVWGMGTAGLKRGVVIVMNPQTAEILALVSLPTYDNNLFATGISQAQFQELLQDPDKPLLNHALNEQYPPGSTYKLVAAAGGLSDAKITAATRLQTQAFLTLGDTRFYEWNRRGWGACDLNCGFGHSSDTYFYQVAGMLGIDRLGYWANQFGFGAKSGIDLPGEVAGIVPTNQWKIETLGAPVYPGETYQAGIGQGYDAVTPIQLINAFAALANGGKLYQPRIVRELVDPDGNTIESYEPTLIHELPVSQTHLRQIREAGRNTVRIRHTYNLIDLPVRVAGKSGTAEFGIRDDRGRLPFHSWFVGFVPKDPYRDDFSEPDSELMVLAFAYDSRTVGNVATEIVKYYFQQHFEIERDYRLFDLLERGNFYRSN